MAPVPLRTQGAYASSQTWSGIAVDVRVLSDVQHASGRRNRVVLAPQRLALKLAMMLRIAPVTVANGKVHRGDHV